MKEIHTAVFPIQRSIISITLYIKKEYRGRRQLPWGVTLVAERSSHAKT